MMEAAQARRNVAERGQQCQAAFKFSRQYDVSGELMKALNILAAVAGIYFPTSALAQVPLETLRTCLEIEDQSKERLNCYDEKVAPAPMPVSAPAKKVEDCRFVKEEDERLNCFNKFVNPPPKKNPAQQKRKAR